MSGAAGTVYDPSPEVLRILANCFAGPNAWKSPAWPEPDAMDRAVAAGVMFRQPRTLDHDGWVDAARSAVSNMSVEELGEAFLASLTSGRMDLRSALGSAAVARFLPVHANEPMPTHGHRCSTCGLYQWQVKPQDLNALSNERFAGSGAAGRDDVTYVAFDLEQFSGAPRLRPTLADISLAHQIIGYLRELPPSTTAAQAAAGLKMVKGNRYTREVLLTILGICGVLASPEHPGYANGFVPYHDRDAPGRRYLYGRYPLWWWRASDEVDDNVLRQIFPQLF